MTPLDVQAEFEAEQEKLKQLSYLSAAEQKKFADRQSIAFMYMKPPGYDAAQKKTEQASDEPPPDKAPCELQQGLAVLSDWHAPI